VITKNITDSMVLLWRMGQIRI